MSVDAEGMDLVRQSVAQLAGVGVVALWSAFATVVCALMVSMIIPMRVTQDEEREGLDINEHGERAYNM